MKAGPMGVADLSDLALLVEVIEAGSITDGAQRCGISLSAASVRITALERHYGLRLLDRRHRGVTPTPAGEALAARGLVLLDGARELEAGMAARARGLENSVRLATNSSAADALTEFLAATLNRLPNTAVTLVELSSEAAVAHVLDGLSDIAVVSSVPAGAACQTRRLWDDDLVAVGPASSPPRRPLRLADLLREPVVGLLRGSPLQDLVDRQAHAAGTEPAYRVRLPSLGAVCAVACTGVGYAVVPRGAARRHGVSPASLYELDEPWAPRHAVLVAADFSTLTEGTAAFVHHLLEHGPALDEEG
ncbi:MULTISPECIES: LysR family transcriptional regulator [Nocardiopsidaceae]|uniref:LysR family transcriptional regulator n=1 Tax=Streptomonospora nanhaiensis TaxID=1323731 RepID=A0ABY6YGH0_9ACTN|nr:LysR family transcriptional regulator [Streptomonospora nanhaiensis]WAE71335.1 LysR family transcriptional regulator [Streptomonospora nanhaiensis]